MTITPEQTARARELREQNFSWEGIARELGVVKGQGRQIRMLIDPGYAESKKLKDAKRYRSRSEWAYGSCTSKAQDRPNRPIVGHRDPVVETAVAAFAASDGGPEARAELSLRLRHRNLPADMEPNVV